MVHKYFSSVQKYHNFGIKKIRMEHAFAYKKATNIKLIKRKSATIVPEKYIPRDTISKLLKKISKNL